jgi:hypothetical protein
LLRLCSHVLSNHTTPAGLTGLFPVHIMLHMPPQMRAVHLQANLDTVHKLRPDVAAQIFGLCPASVDFIRGALRTDWLDVSHDVAVTEAMATVVGIPGVRAFNRDALKSALRSPLLKSIWDGAVTLFGLKPSGLLRWAPQFWDQLYRECGTLRYDAQRKCLVAQDLPELLVASQPWCEGLAGAVDAVLELCKLEGQVRVETQGPRGVLLFMP